MNAMMAARAESNANDSRAATRQGDLVDTRLPRRTLLVAPALLAAADTPDTLRLQPGGAVLRVVAEAPERDGFRLWVEGEAAPLEVPPLRARRLPNLKLAGRELIAVAFAADLPGQSVQDVMAVAGWDGMALRLLALETLVWRRPDGASAETRLAATADGKALQLSRVARMARPLTRPFHRSWTDLLAWRDGAPLADAAPRPPPAGSWQAEMRATRARVATFLSSPRLAVNETDLATCGLLQQFDCMADG